MKIVLQNLTKIFPSRNKKSGEEVVAVNNFDFTIPDGKLIGLLGPSGCGKSTTLYMISGLQKPSSGKIFFGEDDVTDLSTENRGIGLVFQNYALYPHLTVKQNILFPLQNLRGKDKMTKEAMLERAHEAARLVQIEELLERKPSELSGGQQQRVAIARALASDPEVLLCDEATSALDPMTTQAILRLLQKINREMGITIVVITHEMAVIRQICTHVAILDGGVIAEEGSVDDVFTHTRSEAGKRLFGIVASENHEQVQEKPAIRIVFNGETIAEPIVADLILHLGVPLSIRSADVHTLNGAQYGQLLISRPDDPMVCHRAIEYLKERGLTVEEVRA